MNPYEALGNAIIIQAAQDYRHALRGEGSVHKTEVERFFRSWWFSQLSELDPEYLIGRLRKEHEEDGY